LCTAESAQVETLVQKPVGELNVTRVKQRNASRKYLTTCNIPAARRYPAADGIRIGGKFGDAETIVPEPNTRLPAKPRIPFNVPGWARRWGD